MKKLIVSVFAIAFLLISIGASAQSGAMEKLYEKYAGEKGFTAVNITAEMFGFIAEMNLDTGEDGEEVNNLIQAMTGVKVLTYTPTKGENPHFDFLKEVKKEFDFSNLTELMSVQEEGEEVKMYVKKKGDKIADFLLIASDTSEITIVNISGLMSLKDIGKISNKMNIDVMSEVDLHE